eukprot:5954579-Pleurochrysis_carterae.AAC.1
METEDEAKKRERIRDNARKRARARGWPPLRLPSPSPPRALLSALYSQAIDSLDSRVDELSAQQASQLETAFANWDCVAVGAELSAAPSPQHSFD